MSFHCHRAVVAAICLFLSWFAVASDSSHPACEPVPEIEAALAQFSRAGAERARSDGQWDDFERTLVAVMERHPFDVHLQRRYQALHQPELENLVARYRQQAADRPEDPGSLYLYGRILLMLERTEAEKPLLDALRIDPLYPWAHLGLARFYDVNQPDPDKAQSHIGAFVEQCPTSQAAIVPLRIITDPEVSGRVAARVRAELAATEDPDLVPTLRAVWAAEFKATSPVEHSAVRERIQSDLTVLRKPRMQQDERALEALLEGCALVGDDEGLTRAIEEMARRFPQNRIARLAATRRFDEQHHAPEDHATSPESQAYYRELSQATLRWVDMWPDDPEVWLKRFRALAGTEGETPEELLSTADTLLERVAQRPDYSTEPPVPFQIAQTLVEKEIGLDRVPGLVDRGLQQVAAGQPLVKSPGQDDALVISQLERTLVFQGWIGREALFDAYMKQGRLDEARRTLGEMERLLPHDSPSSVSGPGDHQLHHLRASWSSRNAALARAEGRAVDALLYYQAALALDPLSQDAPRDAAAELWRELGAGDEALRSWSAAGGAHEAPFGEPSSLTLPDFEFQDLEGRTWRLADLRGKVILINVWATWCPPCQFELPWLQELHDRTQDRPDLVVLTLNVDENWGVVEPIMRRNGYDFPVVFAFDYLLDLWGYQWALPRTWIVDPQGTVRREQSGFDGDGERWLADAMQAMERVALEAQSALR